MDLRELYQDIILDHGRHPRNFRPIAEPTHLMHGHNPLCGDRVTVFLTLRQATIAEISFEGRGCAISTASASLMTEILSGRTLEEAELLYQAFHAQVTGGAMPSLPPVLVEHSERLLPLTGVKAYPARVKCATLAWHALRAAVAGGATGSTVQTE